MSKPLSQKEFIAQLTELVKRRDEHIIAHTLSSLPEVQALVTGVKDVATIRVENKYRLSIRFGGWIGKDKQL